MHDFQEQCRVHTVKYIRKWLVDLLLEHSLFFVIVFKTKSNKTIIRFAFYDIRNKQGLSKSYRKNLNVVFHLFHSTQPVENHPYYHMASSMNEQDVPNCAVIGYPSGQDVIWVWFPNPASYVGWVCCWFSTLLREVFLRVLQFSPSSPQKPTFSNSNSILECTDISEQVLVNCLVLG